MRGRLVVACAWLCLVGCRAEPTEALATARDRPADPNAGPAVQSTMESVDAESLMQAVEPTGAICLPVYESSSSEPSTADENEGASTPAAAPRFAGGRAAGQGAGDTLAAAARHAPGEDGAARQADARLHRRRRRRRRCPRIRRCLGRCPSR